MPAFVEWMMGLPEGWTEGPARTHRLRMLGNAVVPAQAAHALRLLDASRPQTGVAPTPSTGERRSA